MASDRLSVVMFSGTDDKLTSAATLITGAAAMMREVDVLLQFWALDAFRSDRLTKDHGTDPSAGEEGREAFSRALGSGALNHWSEVLRQAKELGGVRIHACAQSMEILGLTRDDLDPLVDDIEGIAAFVGDAEGQLVNF